MMMAGARNLWDRSRTVASIWLISALGFFFLYRMALRNLSESFPSPPDEQRSRLYDSMAKDLGEKGALFLNQGETSQSLTLSDLFTERDGIVTPVLKPADPPVRANVLYLSPEYSVRISDAVKSIFLPYFEKAIWFQNSSMYHFSMFHASHHATPVHASDAEREAETNAVKAIAENLCPLKVVVDRVVLTSTGVLLGCWQVTSGTDPVTIRAKLRTALPHAPKKQFYDAAILHTSFARILGRPMTLSKDADKASELLLFHDLVAQLNNQLRGFQAAVYELWYVEEYDVLALALDGRIKAHKFQLGCSSP